MDQPREVIAAWVILSIPTVVPVPQLPFGDATKKTCFGSKSSVLSKIAPEIFITFTPGCLNVKKRERERRRNPPKESVECQTLEVFK